VNVEKKHLWFCVAEKEKKNVWSVILNPAYMSEVKELLEKVVRMTKESLQLKVFVFYRLWKHDSIPTVV
jgi:hypothetical protein